MHDFSFWGRECVLVKSLVSYLGTFGVCDEERASPGLSLLSSAQRSFPLIAVEFVILVILSSYKMPELPFFAYFRVFKFLVSWVLCLGSASKRRPKHPLRSSSAATRGSFWQVLWAKCERRLPVANYRDNE